MSEFPIVLVKNLPYTASSEALYGLFGKYGPINQVRVPENSGTGPTPGNLGTCFIIYNNVSSAKKAAAELNGVNFEGRYLVSTMYHVDRSKLQQEDLMMRKDQVEKLKRVYGVQ
jgi:pre-mRNA branch site protein p14